MEIKDLVGLEKPATELINRVSDAVGGIAKPWQIKRVAHAEAEAKKILAVADLETTEIRERAVRRMVLEEERNQQNIEAVTAKAIPHLSAEAKPEELDEDFVRYLFEKARLVSNEEMQSIWAKILAAEAGQTGTFSRRTMDLVSQMRKEDAELFTRLCGSVWMIGGPVPFITEFAGKRSEDDFSLTYEELSHLDSIGLITFRSGSHFMKQGLHQKSLVGYYGCTVVLQLPKENDNDLHIGHALLTKTGKELVRIAGSRSSRKALEAGMRYFMARGISVSIPLDAKHQYLAL